MEPHSLTRNVSLDKRLSQPLSQLQFMPQEFLLKLAVEVLHISSDERDDKHNRILRFALQEVNFFKKMIGDKGDYLFEQCLNRIQHQKMHKDQIVCSIGDPGSAFYVVMTGTVSVNVLVQKIDEKVAQKTHGKKIQTYLDLEEVAVLKAGSYFGELALLNDAPRTATIICKEDCDFAVLFRKDFKEILSKHTLWQIQQDIQFFSSLPLFATSSRRAISTLIYHFKLLKLQRNNVIFKEGDEATHLYIIKKGEVKISKTITVKPEPDPFVKEEEIRPAKLMKRVLEVNIFVNGYKIIRAKLAILGQKEIFGEEELYYGTKREITAVVSSIEADIFALEKKDFEKRLLETNEFISYLKSYCKDKLETRNKRIQFIIETASQKRSMVWRNTNRPTSSTPRKHVRRERHKASTEIINLANAAKEKKSVALANKQDQSPAFSTVQYVSRSNNQSPLVKIGTPSANQSPINNKNNDSLSPSSSFLKPLINSINQSFYGTQMKPVKKDSKISIQNNSNNRKMMMFSTLDSPRHRSQPRVSQSIFHKGLNLPVSVVPTRTLFEKKIFEKNFPGTGIPTKLKLNKYRVDQENKLSHLNLSEKVDQKYSCLNAPSDVGNRFYFTSKTSEPKRAELDFQNAVIKAQEMLLTSKFHHHPVKEDHISMDVLDDPSPVRHRKQNQSPMPPSRNVSVRDRIKNISNIQANQPSKIEDIPDIKNIHVHAKRMQAFVKAVFKTQVKIFNRIRDEEISQRMKASGKNVKTLNKSAMIKEPVTIHRGITPINLNRSELIMNSARSSLADIHDNYDYLNLSQIKSIDHTARDLSLTNGISVRSLIRK